MLAMRRLTSAVCSFAAVLAAAGAQAQGVRSESSIAGRNPAQVFASDCTGSGCHSGPQGLAKDKTSNALAAYLRAHYTDSRQTAAALAAYLMGVGGEARSTGRKPERAERAEPPQPRELQDRANREPQGWFSFQLPKLFGGQEAEELPPQQEVAPPPKQGRQRATATSRTQETERARETDRASATPNTSSGREQAQQSSEDSLLSAISSLFRREAEPPPASSVASPEPAKPASRTRQTSRQAPRDEQSQRSPGTGESAPSPARRSIRQAPKLEPEAKPPGEEVTPSARPRTSARPSPKPEAARTETEAVSPEAAAKSQTSEERPKPRGDVEATSPQRTRQIPRPAPKNDATIAPASTGAVVNRSRRTEPFPVTEDNAGPPSASDIYRPARRDTPPAEASGHQIAPNDVTAPAREPGQRLPIFD